MHNATRYAPGHYAEPRSLANLRTSRHFNTCLFYLAECLLYTCLRNTNEMLIKQMAHLLNVRSVKDDVGAELAAAGEFHQWRKGWHDDGDWDAELHAVISQCECVVPGAKVSWLRRA